LTLRQNDNATEGSRLSEYDQYLPDRYFVSGSSVSWDVEESPPIQPSLDNDPFDVSVSNNEGTVTDATKDAPPNGSRTDSSSYSENATSDPGKVKYRCKLCGQLKQNHHCPHQQPLQRSIGVMVYAAVNSYTAAEPGVIAPPLTKMIHILIMYHSSAPWLMMVIHLPFILALLLQNR
jgi:hypothetical protein